jgi:hypothetical protein
MSRNVYCRWSDETREHAISRPYTAHLLRAYRLRHSVFQLTRRAAGLYEVQNKYPGSPVMILSTRFEALDNAR